MNLTLTLNGISYRELNEGSGKASIGDDGQGTAERVLACAWADRNNLKQQLLGDATQDAGGTVTIIPRQAHPSYTGMFASNADIEPIGRPSATNTWNYAKLTVRYKTMAGGGSFNPIDLREENVELCGEVVSDDGSNWMVDTGETNAGDTLQTSPKKVIASLTYTVAMYRVTGLPVATISLVGTINNAAFKGFAAYHVEYQGFSSTRRTTTEGNPLWTVTHKFRVSPYDLRTHYHKGVMQKVKTRVGGQYLYDAADFSALGVGI